jgi:hypothetical protein
VRDAIFLRDGKFAFEAGQHETASASGRHRARTGLRVLLDDFFERIRIFKAILGDVDGASLDQTIDTLKRKVNAENELSIWQRIAALGSG